MCNEFRSFRVSFAEKFGIDDKKLSNEYTLVFALCGIIFIAMGIFFSIFVITKTSEDIITASLSYFFGIAFLILAYLIHKSFHWKQLPQCIINRGWRTLRKMADDDGYKKELNGLICMADFTMRTEQSNELRDWLDNYDKFKEVDSEIVGLTHARDDMTAKLFEKDKEKKDLEKELISSA